MSSLTKAVLFDAYGTLFDVYSVSARAEALYPGKGSALAALWRSKQLEYTWLRSLSGRYLRFWELTRAALEFSVKALGLPINSADLDSLMSEYSRLKAFPENLNALMMLRDQGLALGILTNGNPEMVDAAVNSAGMTGLFAQVLSADSVQVYKTDPRVYRLGEQAFACPANEMVFVSSNAWDACAATWYGYRAVWVNRSKAPFESLGVEPWAQISGLQQLPELLMCYTSHKVSR